MMRPAMLPSELAMFESVVRCSINYVEFGCGGSTAVAADMTGKSVTSVDSSQVWLDKVEAFCASKSFKVKPHLVLADIGPTRELGYPADESCRSRWPDYYSAIWDTPGANNADTFLVDGRFRVACFLQVMLHAPTSAIVMVHDFYIRPEYHVIYNVAREIARTENLSVFQRTKAFRPADATRILQEYAFDPR
jgi:hypothetical protein